jgi:hypothetical protein
MGQNLPNRHSDASFRIAPIFAIPVPTRLLESEPSVRVANWSRWEADLTIGAKSSKTHHALQFGILGLLRDVRL